jgi:hypothetical protein
MDVKLSDAAIEQLLTHFVEGALGLDLPASQPTANASAHFECPDNGSNRGHAVCVSWRTDRGTARICGVYDSTQSLRIRAHVLWLAWWLPSDIHHEGWWRCDQKRLNEWTKGRGRDLGTHRGSPEPDGGES